MNINTNQTIPLAVASGSIDYVSGNRLVYFQNNKANYRTFLFDYTYYGKTIRLNDLLLMPNKWAVLPVESRFYTRLTESGKIKDVPELQLSIPELENDEMHMLSALHEIGHTRYCDNMNAQRNKKEARVFDDHTSTFIDKNSRYGVQLIRTRMLLEEIVGQRTFCIIEERNAWAFALKTMRKLELFKDASKKDVQDFYRTHLGSYGDDFI